MASDANANRAISVSSTGEASRPLPAKKSRRELKKAEKQAKLTSNEAALEAVRLEKIRLRNVRLKFWPPTIVIGIFILVGVFTTTLVQEDNSVSLIWLIPLAFLLLAIVVGLLDKNADNPMKRIILSLIAGIILLIGFLLLTSAPLAFAVTDFWGFVAGNHVRGEPGVWYSLGSFLGGIWGIGPFLAWLIPPLGAIVTFVGLVIALPTLALSLMFQEIAYESNPSMKTTLSLALLALAVFIFPIGLSITGNLGF